MKTSINKVPGIGSATAKILALHGIKSAEDLAVITVNDLIAVKGFSDIRAAHIIQAAEKVIQAGRSVAKKPKKSQLKKSGKQINHQRRKNPKKTR